MPPPTLRKPTVARKKKIPVTTAASVDLAAVANRPPTERERRNAERLERKAVLAEKPSQKPDYARTRKAKKQTVPPQLKANEAGTDLDELIQGTGVARNPGDSLPEAFNKTKKPGLNKKRPRTYGQPRTPLKDVPTQFPEKQAGVTAESGDDTLDGQEATGLIAETKAKRKRDDARLGENANEMQPAKPTKQIKTAAEQPKTSTPTGKEPKTVAGTRATDAGEGLPKGTGNARSRKVSDSESILPDYESPPDYSLIKRNRQKELTSLEKPGVIGEKIRPPHDHPRSPLRPALLPAMTGFDVDKDVVDVAEYVGGQKANGNVRFLTPNRDYEGRVNGMRIFAPAAPSPEGSQPGIDNRGVSAATWVAPPFYNEQESEIAGVGVVSKWWRDMAQLHGLQINAPEYNFKGGDMKLDKHGIQTYHIRKERCAWDVQNNDHARTPIPDQLDHAHIPMQTPDKAAGLAIPLRTNHKKPHQMAPRKTKKSLRDILFECFRSQKYWELEQLAVETCQPESYLLSVLDVIAEVSRQVDESGIEYEGWHLRPMYKERDRRGVDEDEAIADPSRAGTAPGKAVETEAQAEDEMEESAADDTIAEHTPISTRGPALLIPIAQIANERDVPTGDLNDEPIGSVDLGLAEDNAAPQAPKKSDTPPSAGLPSSSSRSLSTEHESKGWWTSPDLLGKGGQGSVYKAWKGDNINGQFCVIKRSRTYKREEIRRAIDPFGHVVYARYSAWPASIGQKAWAEHEDPSTLETLRREVKALRLFDHANIVSYIGHSHINDTMIMLMEEAQGNLHDLATDERFGRGEYTNETPPEIEHTSDEWEAKTRMLWKAWKDVLRGLAEIHGKGIVHFDIKFPNILYRIPQNQTDHFEKYIFKISDFGGCRKVGDTRRGVSTPLYMAPEQRVIYSNVPEGAHTGSDMWSTFISFAEHFEGKNNWLLRQYNQNDGWNGRRDGFRKAAWFERFAEDAKNIEKRVPNCSAMKPWARMAELYPQDRMTAKAAYNLTRDSGNDWTMRKPDDQPDFVGILYSPRSEGTNAAGYSDDGDVTSNDDDSVESEADLMDDHPNSLRGPGHGLRRAKLLVGLFRRGGMESGTIEESA